MKKYLEEQVHICQQKVEQYANQPDRHSQDMWYYWYGCLRANQKALEHLRESLSVH